MKTTKEKVIEISVIVPKISHFEFEGFDEDEYEAYDSLTFVTRENGDAGAETPGEADLVEAVRIASEIIGSYPEATYSIYSVDEWVYLEFNF